MFSDKNIPAQVVKPEVCSPIILSEKIVENGLRGQNNYELWLQLPGNAGKTIEEYYESLKGEKGEAGTGTGGGGFYFNSDL